ncbi:MAG: hypothetical protein IJ351_05280 [Oscillospiraceae bacterium]|nr:hypothetical protein [Oscillospiraceae bacterium]
MEKSNLGLPVKIFAALTYLLALFGGYVPAILVTGYILLREDDNFLRRAAVKSMAVLVACSVLSILFNLLPDMVDMLRSMIMIFGGFFSTGFLDNMSAFFANTLSLAKSVVLVLLAVLAVFNKSIDIKPLSAWADKY